MNDPIFNCPRNSFFPPYIERPLTMSMVEGVKCYANKVKKIRDNTEPLVTRNVRDGLGYVDGLNLGLPLSKLSSRTSIDSYDDLLDTGDMEEFDSISSDLFRYVVEKNDDPDIESHIEEMYHILGKIKTYVELKKDGKRQKTD